MGISLDEVLLDASTSSIAISDGTDTLAVNGDGSINATVSGSVTVSATDLDTRDLVFATDKVDVTGSEVALDAATLAALETITVVQELYAAGKSTTETVTTTAAEVVATPLANRREVTIQNEGTQPVYLGFDNTVTAANGIKISKNSSATYAIPAAVDIWMIAGSGSQDVRFLELGV